MKFDIQVLFFLNLSRKFRFNKNRAKIIGTLYEDQYNYDHISLSSSWNEKCFRRQLYRKSKHTFCSKFFFSKIVPFIR
jgi:hypothetical protein